MLDALVNEDVDICSARAFDIMYGCLRSVSADKQYSLYEEEKYGLKISVEEIHDIAMVRGCITNRKVIICFVLTDEPSVWNKVESINYDDKIYASLCDATSGAMCGGMDSNIVTSMIISSLICRNVKSARK